VSAAGLWAQKARAVRCDSGAQSGEWLRASHLTKVDCRVVSRRHPRNRGQHADQVGHVVERRPADGHVLRASGGQQTGLTHGGVVLSSCFLGMIRPAARRVLRASDARGLLRGAAVRHSSWRRAMPGGPHKALSTQTLACSSGAPSVKPRLSARPACHYHRLGLGTCTPSSRCDKPPCFRLLPATQSGSFTKPHLVSLALDLVPPRLDLGTQPSQLFPPGGRCP
jgi:hypothetical protein